MMELLKVGRLEGKKGSTTKVKWTAAADLAFEGPKEALSRELSLQTVRPYLPFVLRADSSGKAIGAVLEQVPAGVKMEPTIKKLIRAGVTVPVAFLSRKLTDSQERTWDVRDKEAYAIVLALDKWGGRIGLQPFLVLTDHKALEHWTTEVWAQALGSPAAGHDDTKSPGSP